MKRCWMVAEWWDSAGSFGPTFNHHWQWRIQDLKKGGRPGFWGLAAKIFLNFFFLKISVNIEDFLKNLPKNMGPHASCAPPPPRSATDWARSICEDEVMIPFTARIDVNGILRDVQPLWETGRLGDWETERLGNWETGGQGACKPDQNLVSSSCHSVWTVMSISGINDRVRQGEIHISSLGHWSCIGPLYDT